jgi:hypothetical protein
MIGASFSCTRGPLLRANEWARPFSSARNARASTVSPRSHSASRTTSLFEGQQQTVTQDGAAYELSVSDARMDIPCPADCPQAEIRFSIVRHL